MPLSPEVKKFFEDMGATVFNLDDLSTNKEARDKPIPESDLEALNDPSCWPHRPMMPVKKRGEHGSECGIVMEGEPGTVYMVNLFNYLGVGQKKLKQLLGDAKVEDYGSWENMLKDGWVCD